MKFVLIDWVEETYVQIRDKVYFRGMESVYDTEKGMELVLGDFHRGTTFTSVELAKYREFLGKLEVDGYYPIFRLQASQEEESFNSTVLEDLAKEQGVKPFDAKNSLGVVPEWGIDELEGAKRWLGTVDKAVTRLSKESFGAIASHQILSVCKAVFNLVHALGWMITPADQLSRKDEKG